MLLLFQLTSLNRVATLGGLAGKHDTVGTVKNGVGDVGDLGTGGTGVDLGSTSNSALALTVMDSSI